MTTHSIIDAARRNLDDDVWDYVSGGAETETIDGHSIQPYYATLLAKDCGLTIDAAVSPESVILTAKRAG